MRIVDEPLLREFCFAPNCEWCNDYSQFGRDPAHIFSRGAGRVDIRENLVALCRLCHNLHHAGLRPTRKELLKVAAKREGTTPKRIERIVQLIRRTPAPIGWQDMTPAQLVAYALRQPKKCW